jgi:endoglucanase
VVTIIPPEGWDRIVAFAKLPRAIGATEARLKERPEQATIENAFAELLENLKLEHCRVNGGYLQALGLKTAAAK